ncbi:MAG TPA: radical SAM protein [Bacteroidales bacterium]|nr:radical SAM protein [Bacteroidales bacterium]
MESELTSIFSAEDLTSLSDCRICPRNCGINRIAGELGYCRSDAAFHISSVCIHKGEEPVISGKKGICNVFFSRCNLQCLFCQNHEISRNKGDVIEKKMTFDEVIQKIKETLLHTENVVGFVSPSHFVPHVKAIINALRSDGLNPVFVYNTNGYDSVDSLKSLEGYIDVYLPDLKYADADLSLAFSQARNYPDVAGEALKEMFRQKGSTLKVDDNGIAVSGMIIRHLVLPDAIENSTGVLRFIAEELSERVHISLMSQYFPTPRVRQIPQLNRLITIEEYDQVTEAFYDLGFFRGWLQEPDSHQQFRPSFENDQAFEV